MKKLLFIAIVVPFFVVTAASLDARTYYRNEMLDQGRRFTNTLNKYLLLSDPETEILVEPQALIFPGYRVDTNQGLARVNVYLISLDAKYSMPDIFSVYTVLHIYDVRSDRKILKVDETTTGLVPARDDKGNTDFGIVKYGLLTELLCGIDVNLFKIARINISGIYSHEELNNSVFDSRPVEYIPQLYGVNFYSGDPLYREYSERRRNSFHPVFGLYLFDSMQSLLTWSPGDRRITAAESVLTYRIGETAGALVGKYNYYQYWGAEHGVMLGMEKMFGFLGFGAEFIARKRYFTDLFIEIKREFRWAPCFVDISLTFNMARTPETIAIKRSAIFKPGGRIDFTVGLVSRDALQNGLFIQFYTVYNHYDSMRLFRGSVDTWGIGFAFGFRLENKDVQSNGDGNEKPRLETGVI
ncbi:MAG: hypothetical protein JXA20_08720 [Spirochaetes bacterium]|nr:hypothetical protein [Spirochaetota bacterium]